MKKISFALLILSGSLLVGCNEDSAENQEYTNTQITNTGTALPNPAASPANPGSPAAPGLGNAPAGNTGKVALNPAHGQPGHRCEIAVGAPLNSAPASSTPAAGSTLPSAPQVITQPNAPATPSVNMPSPTLNTNPQPASTGGNAKLNPAHGQPGHDCAIPVGSPLKN